CRATSGVREAVMLRVLLAITTFGVCFAVTMVPAHHDAAPISAAVRYLTLDRPELGQHRELLATPEATAAAAPGLPPPAAPPLPEVSELTLLRFGVTPETPRRLGARVRRKTQGAGTSRALTRKGKADAGVDLGLCLGCHQIGEGDAAVVTRRQLAAFR